VHRASDRLRFDAPFASHTLVTEPAVGKCACGREVQLFDNKNDCPCGRAYNLFGQQIQRLLHDESGQEDLAGDEGYEYDRESDEGDRVLGNSL